MARSLAKLMAVAAGLWLGAIDARPAAADNREHAPIPRRDQYGDPLPDGAIARLGTLRLVHLGGLTAVAVSPDGKMVASGVSEGKLITSGGKTTKEGGLTFISGAETRIETMIRLWDASTGKLIREIVTPDAPVMGLAFDSSGTALFVGCGKYTCRFNPATGEKCWQKQSSKGIEFVDPRNSRQDLVVSQDKLFVMLEGYLSCEVKHEGGVSWLRHVQRILRCYELGSGKAVPLPKEFESTIATNEGFDRLIHEAAFSPDGAVGAILVSQANPVRGGDPGEKWKYTNYRLLIADLKSGKVLHALGHDSRSLTFSDDAKTLAMVADKCLWTMSVESGKKVAIAKNLPSWMRQLKFLGNSRLAALFGDDGIRVWDVSTGLVVKHRIDKHCFATTVGGGVAAVMQRNAICLFEAESGKPLHRFDGHRSTPLLRFALHSKKTLLSRDQQQLAKWDTVAWKHKSTTRFPSLISDDWRWVSQLEKSRMDQSIALESQIYAKDVETGIELCDMRTDRLVRSLKDSAGKPRWCYFSADGKRLVTHEDKAFQFFDVESGKRISALPGKNEPIWLGYNAPDLLSPHGNYFAKNRSHKQIDLFDVQSCKLSHALAQDLYPDNGNRRSILGYDFSRDERMVLAEVHEQVYENGFSEEKVGVMLWDTKSGKAVQEVVLNPSLLVFWRETLGQQSIAAFTLSNDHRLLAVVGQKTKTIEIWEVASGTKRGELTGHDGPVVDLAFSPDDRQLASSSEDTTILIWDVSRPLQPSKFKKRLSAEELAGHWQTLFQPDAKKADTAIWALVHAGKDTVPFVRDQLRPALPPDDKRVQAWLAALNSPDYKVRATAEVELEKLGELALAGLEAARKGNNTLETNRRLDGLLRKARKDAMPFGTLMRTGQCRALEVLERIGSTEARQVLKELGNGAPGARLTVSANAILARLAKAM